MDERPKVDADKHISRSKQQKYRHLTQSPHFLLPPHATPAAIVLPTSCSIREAKVRTNLREGPLQAMHTMQTIMCSMIKFHCDVCDRRFPAFHPDHEPPFALDVLRHCSNAVAHWNEKPGPPEHIAPTHTGICQKCCDSLKRVEHNEDMQDVAIFSAANKQLPLHNFPAMRRVDVLDITYQQLFEQATVCEAMLVAILHMQVNVCMFEGRQVSRTGITRFRKNIICFPQHVSDLQQHIDFANSVAVNDILNIRR